MEYLLMEITSCIGSMMESASGKKSSGRLILISKFMDQNGLGDGNALGQILSLFL